jgi:predicted DsbA family dithiol-disulfide isomerase
VIRKNFKFNGKYGVSGAQESPVFLDMLHKSFADWAKDHSEVIPKHHTYSFKPG